MTDAERARFDALLDETIDSLPPALRDLLDEVPVIVDDRPSPALLRSLGVPHGASLCGLHTGVAMTERSVEQSGIPTDVIQLFREGIVHTAGGWRQRHANDAVHDEIEITLLHEIGHHFGLDEDDLAALGYG